MKRLATLVVMTLLLSLSSPIWAKTVYFDANLNGEQANNGAGTGSPGTGSATDIVYDSISRELAWELSWGNLEADVTMAHIHGPAAADASGPPIVTLDITSNPAIGSARLTAQQIDYLFAGQLYINIHTNAHPGGEIRGQILPQTASQSVIGTLQRNQWGAFVLSGNPQGITIEQLFSGETALDLRAENYKNNWNVYTFNIGTQNFDLLELDDSIQQGQAFWIIQSTFDSHEVVVENSLPHADLKPLTGCNSVHGCVSVPIADQASTNYGWAFVGSPYHSDNGENVVAIADLAVSVTNGPESCQSSCTFSTAIDAGLVGDTLYVYDAAAGTYLSLGIGDSLENGKAVWVSLPGLTQASAIELIVPNTEPEPEEPPPEEPPPEEPPPEEPPGTGLAAITDFEYAGAFRLTNGEFGNSSLDYAVGTLAVNPTKQSLFIAGHAQHESVAEYPIIQAGMQTEVGGLPETGAPLQNFVGVLAPLPNPQGINRITGMYWLDGSLIINAENWYDAGAGNTDTTLVVPNADNLNAGAKGFFQLQGAAHAGGYMGPIPEQWQSAFGAQHYTGWSSVYSIISRYSLGPSLWTFDASSLINADPTTNSVVPTQPKLNYPYGGSGGTTHLSERALEWAEQGTAGPFPPSDALWNPLSAGRYGFFIPGTKTFAVIGHTAGLQSGIGYKAVQSDGTECGGPCPYNPADYTNYYWFYNVEDILSASELYQPKPYAYGSFDVPFDADGKRPIIGATFDPTTKTLYLAVEDAAQIAEFDRPPLIVTYKLE